MPTLFYSLPTPPDVTGTEFSGVATSSAGRAGITLRRSTEESALMAVTDSTDGITSTYMTPVIPTGTKHISHQKKDSRIWRRYWQIVSGWMAGPWKITHHQRRIKVATTPAWPDSVSIEVWVALMWFLTTPMLKKLICPSFGHSIGTKNGKPLRNYLLLPL